MRCLVRLTIWHWVRRSWIGQHHSESSLTVSLLPKVLKLITIQSLLSKSKWPGTLDPYGKELEINVLPKIVGRTAKLCDMGGFRQGRFWLTAYLIPNNHETGGSLWCSPMTGLQAWAIYDFCSHQYTLLYFLNASSFKLVAQLMSSWGRWPNLWLVWKERLLERRYGFDSRKQPPPCWLRPSVLLVLLAGHPWTSWAGRGKQGKATAKAAHQWSSVLLSLNHKQKPCTDEILISFSPIILYHVCFFTILFTICCFLFFF